MPKPQPKINSSFLWLESTYDKAKKRADEQDISLSRFIEQAVSFYLAELDSREGEGNPEYERKVKAD